VVQVAQGYWNYAAVTSAGAVWMWGKSMFYEENVLLPTQVDNMPEKVLQVAAGNCHMVARTITGAVWTWGKGDAGALGLCNRSNARQPTQVQTLASEHVVQVAAGESHTVLLTSTGVVWTCGDTQLNRHVDQSRFGRVSSLGTDFVVCVAAYDTQTMVVTTRGTVYCYRDNVPHAAQRNFNAITGLADDAVADGVVADAAIATVNLRL